jgi:hypothetical protein
VVREGEREVVFLEGVGEIYRDARGCTGIGNYC